MTYQYEIAEKIRRLQREVERLQALEQPSSATGFVDLVSNQTVGGIKTFSSIPVLPASDPTTDNEATRKGYVDSVISPVKIIAMKYAEFTGTQSQSVNRSEEFNVTDLAIAHAVAKATNKLILIGQIGQYSNSLGGAQGGIGFAADNTMFFVGDASSTRIRVGAQGNPASANQNWISIPLYLATVYSPNSTDEITYTIRAKQFQHSSGDGTTIYINRSARNDAGVDGRTASSLILIEVEL